MKNPSFWRRSAAALVLAVALCGCGGDADTDDDKTDGSTKVSFTVTGTVAVPTSFTGMVEGVAVLLIKPENFPPAPMAMPDVILIPPGKVEGISSSSPYVINASMEFEPGAYHLVAVLYVQGGGLATFRPISTVDLCYGAEQTVDFQSSPADVGQLLTVICP